MTKTTISLRTKMATEFPTTKNIPQLRYTHGNRTVTNADGSSEYSGIQRKLCISTNNNSMELEADRVANQILAKKASQSPNDAPPHIRHHAGQVSKSSDTIPRTVEYALAQPGSPLPPTLRKNMEQRFCRDFSKARVHLGRDAELSALDLNARAYTIGHNIVFGKNQFSPFSHVGQKLLAHELTHVVQQEGTNGAAFPSILQRQAIEFEPEVITVSRSRRSRILRRAGWKQTNVTIIARDFNGEPMTGRRVFAEFSAANVARVVEGGDIRGGVVTLSNVWVKPSGTVRIMAVSLGRPRLVPQGVIFYRLPRSGGLRLEATQRAREITVTAATSEEAARTAGATGSVGIDFEVVSMGGQISSQSTTSRGRSTSRSWKVTIPTSTFDIRQVI